MVTQKIIVLLVITRLTCSRKQRERIDHFENSIEYKKLELWSSDLVGRKLDKKVRIGEKARCKFCLKSTLLSLCIMVHLNLFIVYKACHCEKKNHYYAQQTLRIVSVFQQAYMANLTRSISCFDLQKPRTYVCCFRRNRFEGSDTNAANTEDRKAFLSGAKTRGLSRTIGNYYYPGSANVDVNAIFLDRI